MSIPIVESTHENVGKGGLRHGGERQGGNQELQRASEHYDTCPSRIPTEVSILAQSPVVWILQLQSTLLYKSSTCKHYLRLLVRLAVVWVDHRRCLERATPPSVVPFHPSFTGVIR